MYAEANYGFYPLVTDAFSESLMTNKNAIAATGNMAEEYYEQRPRRGGEVVFGETPTETFNEQPKEVVVFGKESRMMMYDANTKSIKYSPVAHMHKKFKPRSLHEGFKWL